MRLLLLRRDGRRELLLLRRDSAKLESLCGLLEAKLESALTNLEGRRSATLVRSLGVKLAREAPAGEGPAGVAGSDGDARVRRPSSLCTANVPALTVPCRITGAAGVEMPLRAREDTAGVWMGFLSCSLLIWTAACSCAGAATHHAAATSSPLPPPPPLPFGVEMPLRAREDTATTPFAPPRPRNAAGCVDARVLAGPTGVENLDQSCGGECPAGEAQCGSDAERTTAGGTTGGAADAATGAAVGGEAGQALGAMLQPGSALGVAPQPSYLRWGSKGLQGVARCCKGL